MPALEKLGELKAYTGYTCVLKPLSVESVRLAWCNPVPQSETWCERCVKHLLAGFTGYGTRKTRALPMSKKDLESEYAERCQ